MSGRPGQRVQSGMPEAFSVATAADVATEVKRRMPRAGRMKLHKLLYFIQATHLAKHGRPAFAEQVEAWQKGPLVADYWRAEANQVTHPTSGALALSVHLCIGNVLQEFGHMNGTQLGDLTHERGPWRQVTNEGTEVMRQPINHELLADYGQKLRTHMMRRNDSEIAAARDALLTEHRRRVAENDPYPNGITAADLEARIAGIHAAS